MIDSEVKAVDLQRVLQHTYGPEYVVAKVTTDGVTKFSVCKGQLIICNAEIPLLQVLVQIESFEQELAEAQRRTTDES